MQSTAPAEIPEVTFEELYRSASELHGFMVSAWPRWNTCEHVFPRGFINPLKPCLVCGVPQATLDLIRGIAQAIDDFERESAREALQ